MLRPQQRQPGKPEGPDIGSLAGDRLTERLAGDGQDFEQSQGLWRQPADPPPEHAVQAELGRKCAAFAQLASLIEVFHQLVDEVRTASRLAHDCLGECHRGGIVLTDQPQRQLSPFSERERLEGDLALVAWGGAIALLLQQDAEKGAECGVFAAVRTDQQQHRCVGWAQQVRQQEGAIQVTPLKIVDGQHERTAVSDAREQLAKRGESPPPQLETGRNAA